MTDAARQLARVWRRGGLVELLAVWLLLFAPLASAQTAVGDPVFESIESNGEIVDGVVTALTHDSRGYLWIGTSNGLIRFDGYRMRRFRNDPADAESLGDDFVRALLAGADGALWVATGTGGLSYFDASRERFRQFHHQPDQPDSLAHDGVLALAPAAERGAIWIGTVGGLDYLSAPGAAFVHHRYAASDPNSISHDTVRSLLLDRSGDLWVGTRSGLSRRRAGSDAFERVGGARGEPDSLIGQYVYALFEASDGRVWVGTQANGAAWIDPADGQLHRLALGEAAHGLSHPWISAITEPRAGELWLATYGTGIDVVDAATGEVRRRIRRDPAVATSLAIDEVTAFHVDRSGLLWVGSWGGGLQRHNPTASAFQTLHYSPTLSGALTHPTVLSVVERPNGQLWVGTAGNGIDVVDRHLGVVGGYRADPQRPGALRDGTVSALVQTADGTLWVGTRQAGLHRFDAATDSFRQIPGASASSDSRVGQLLASASGRLLVAAESGLGEFDPVTETAARVGMEDGSAFSLPVSDLAEDGAGRLWVGTARGLLVRAAGAAGLRWVSLAGAGSAPAGDGKVQAVLVDHRQTLWVFVQDRLLYADSAAADPLFRELDLGIRWGERLRPGGMQADAHGRLWAQNFLIDPARRRVIEFGRAEGADIGATTECSAAGTRDGVLLFGGTRGLLMIDAAHYSDWTYAPPLVATAFAIDGRPQSVADLAHGITLGPGGRRVSVEFAALDYSAPLRNRYRYQLQGFDADWIETDADHRVATYGNLWPGDYTLLLSGSNRAGDFTTDPLRIALKVLPAYWQTPWFAALLVVALLLIVLAAYRLRTARIRHRAHELGVLVELRSAELNAANQHLLETQQRLAVQEKMAALGSLVAGVAHEVSTPLGVTMTALSGIADAWRRLRAAVAAGRLARPTLEQMLDDGDEYTALAVQNSNRVASLVENLKAIVARRDSDRVARINLAVHLREAAALVSGELQRRGQRIEVEVADDLQLTTVPDALTEVLSRVLTNTLDHAFAEGSRGWVRISAREVAGAQIEIVVADNGQGIPGEALAQVFEPFFTTRRGIDGRIGLGLHVAYNHVIQRLKGTIEVQSEPGAGTRVIIRLPR